MTRLIKQINERIDTSPEEFAKSFNRPNMSEWIKTQYEHGNTSRDGYFSIIKWADDINPVLPNYDFKKALNKAREYEDNLKDEMNYEIDNDKYMSKDVVVERDGDKWLKIGKDDLKLASVNLNADLMPFENYENFILIDSQDRTVVALIKTNNKYKLIGHSWGGVTQYSELIKLLCVKLGLDLSPDALTNKELVDAIKSGQIKVSKINNLGKTLERLSPEQILDCGLINYTTNLSLSKVYKLYKLTTQQSILKYCICSLIYHGLTTSKLYDACKKDIQKFPEFIAELNKAKNDSDILSIMNGQAKVIMNLD